MKRTLMFRLIALLTLTLALTCAADASASVTRASAATATPRFTHDSFVVGAEQNARWRSAKTWRGRTLFIDIRARGELLSGTSSGCHADLYGSGIAVHLSQCGSPWRLRIRAASTNTRPIRVFLKYRAY